MSQVTELLVRIKEQGGEQLTRLQGSLKNLAQQTAATNINFKEASAELRRIQQTSTQSINNLKGYSSAWREIANSVDIASAEFKQATAEADRLDRQLNKIQGRSGGRGGLAKGAQIAGTIAGAGVFGGLEGALGAGIGGVVGGVPGAITGGAIGAQVGALRQAVGAIAENIAALNKYRIALAGVSKDQDDYNESIKAVSGFSKQFLLPLSQTTEQYTRLKASIIGAGLSTKETNVVFRGISAAIIGTGGNAEKLNAALNATSQVFSKGKVSAEELRQQIGERLPGAFTIFAQSLNKTPAELDKALEDGKVTLADFLKFSEELFKRYGKTAEILALAPENAGARMKVALELAGISFGGFFQVVGAGFQNLIAGVLSWALENETSIKRVVTIFAIGFTELGKIVGAFAKFLVGVFNTAFSTLLGNLDTVLQRIEAAINRAKAVQSLTPQRISQFQEQARKATNERFGGPAGLFTFLRAGEADKFYNQYFDNLVDKATKSAGAKKYTDTVKNILFPEFTPSSFGTGLGNQQLASQLAGGAGDAAAAKAKKGKEIVDRTDEELKLIREINRLRREGLDTEAEFVEFELRKIEIALDLDAKRIGTNRAIERSEENKTRLAQALQNAFKGYGDEVLKSLSVQLEVNRAIQDAEIKAGIITQEKAKQLLIERQIADFVTRYPSASAEAVERFKIAISTSKKELTEAEQLGKSVVTTFADGLSSAFDSLFDRAKSFNEILKDVLRSTSKLLFQFALKGALKGLFPGLGFADGGIMTSNGPMLLKRYAAGGIANSPQLAMFGEGSQPEAYVPLPDGRTIPVTMKNGGSTNVVVNVDARGSNVQGEQGESAALGRAVAGAVQAELIRQKRPGGLLAA